MEENKHMKKSLLSLSCVLMVGVGISACSSDDAPEQSEGANKIDQVENADGSIVKLDDSVPQVDGLEVSAPTNAGEAIDTMCNIDQWWLNKGTSAENREEVAPFLLSISSDYIDDSNAIASDVASSSAAMARSGFSVGDSLNKGQDSARRSCGISSQ